MEHTLPRSKRLTRKEEFTRVFASGNKVSHRGLTAWLSPAPRPRLGCAIPRAYGNAVMRNRLKRRLRAVFRERYEQLPAADIVISASARKEPLSYHEIDAFFRHLGANSPTLDQ